jgi:hypothetical protein
MKKYDFMYGQRAFNPLTDTPENEDHAAAINGAIQSGKQVDVDNGNKVYANGFFIARLK